MIVFLVKIVDLRNINIIKKFGGLLIIHTRWKDWSLIKRWTMLGGPTQMENAKIIMIKFQISPPKTNIKQSSELFVIYYHFESVIY